MYVNLSLDVSKLDFREPAADFVVYHCLFAYRFIIGIFGEVFCFIQINTVRILTSCVLNFEKAFVLNLNHLCVLISFLERYSSHLCFRFFFCNPLTAIFCSFPCTMPSSFCCKLNSYRFPVIYIYIYYLSVRLSLC